MSVEQESAILQRVMRAVAQRRTLCVFASTKIQRSARRSPVGLGQEIGAFVRAVAKWLAPAFAAGAPEILFALNNLNRVGAFLCDGRI
jgi:hypothetical protein